MIARAFSILALGAVLAACGSDGDTAQSIDDSTPPAAVATVSDESYPKRVYFGDTHLHTMNSGDAILYGARLTAEDALRFARGEKVKSSNGIEAQLDRPLDFLVIADHAELIGVGREIYDGNPVYMSDPTLKRWHDMMRGTREEASTAARELIAAYAQGKLPPVMRDKEKSAQLVQSVWQAHLKTVERYNEPGTFSAFIGYEFTSLPKGNNLHRNVIFRDGAAKVSKVLPFSALQSPDPENLWAYLANYETQTGGRALAIPHNGNLSNGLMFALADFKGQAMTGDYATRRARWEPIAEVTQIKGDGETHPFLSPNDEFASFGKAGWDIGNLDNSTAKTNAMLAGEYAREALKRGLQIEARLGVNPFKFGMIGSTDSHTALATADDKNFFGKFAATEPRAGRAAEVGTTGDSKGRIGWHFLASGYAAVWATSNTREALFDAMMRKEVYGTTGPRMTVRFFGGWDFGRRDLRDFVAAGYARGVPMGGDLKSRGASRAPTFIVSALKDPNGANLDRFQVVKGWVDEAGKARERVFDVVWSDPKRRRVSRKGKLTPVGDTVSLATATYRNTIGAAELATVWTDPAFDPASKAFYYVRAIEIPTPRWPAYDAVRFGVKMPAGVQMKAQERAYTSPIWYAP